MQHLTPQEVEAKYRKPDGTIDIPGDIIMIMPNKKEAMSANKVKGSTKIHDMEVKDGKVFIDGVEKEL